MKQEWIKLGINCDSEEVAIERETSLNRNENVKDVVRDGMRIDYKQLTWVDSGYEHEVDNEN